MELLRDGAAVSPGLAGGAIAIGNFDGVHIGHQAVIGAAVARARAGGVAALVATFEPHPSRFFRPETPPFALTTLDQKLELFAGLGVDAVAVLPFDAALAGLPAETFVADWLVGRLKPAHVVTGEDFSFGRQRGGNAAMLAALGRDHGFTTQALAPVLKDGVPISSTRVRAALDAGDMAEAARLLTRPFTIRGEVIHGDKRGRTIGVPTANMEMGAYCRPKYGVYAVRVRLPDGSLVNGVANLGIRPMFEPPKLLLETWILDWSGDLYGAVLDVALVAYLRGEARFDGLDALKAQIAEDAKAARAALGEVVA
jgi:riboflavin kinase/FMN adenylyltransferase